ncbi:putative oxidoreductase [Lachnellula hyalina]|uniref:Putative oxidoreductase n=1 Tax=Lachnellula hyalina TaxID=1316788 RepID=A0A8H8QZ13_9HELO|nr:putative oxidoreductase [Lachnellula hyalina]TVY24375.1 putative oxidoreductase [Lachnellula hyalina]
MPQTWLVVGASRGIGLEFTTQLLLRGETVIATKRSASESLDALLETPNGKKNLTVLRCEVRYETSIKNFALEVGKLGEEGGVLEGGVIDYVVINAGVLQYPNRISDVSFTSFTHHLTTNTIGPLQTASTLLSLPLHIKTLIFISSDSGSAQAFLSHEDGFGAYAASKAALNQGLRHLSFEMHRKYVASKSLNESGGGGKSGSAKGKTVVLALHPGEVSTDMVADINLGWEVKGVIGVRESVSGCLGVIGEKGFGGVDEGGWSSVEEGREDEEGAATFWTWDGRRYPW